MIYYLNSLSTLMNQQADLPVFREIGKNKLFKQEEKLIELQVDPVFLYYSPQTNHFITSGNQKLVKN